MFNLLKIFAAFAAISAVGFQLARWADSFAAADSLALAKAPGATAEDIRPIESDATKPLPVMESLVSSFLDSKAEAGAFALKKKLGALDIAELEDFYIEALSFDLEDRRAFEAAGLALEAVAMQDPGLAVQLLYALSPAEKQRLATALTNGWAKYDAVSAWDWIDSAWVDADGKFIDRRLQNRMFHEALDVVLVDHRDFQLAATLATTAVEPELRLALADLIADRVVSANPEQALSRLDFESDALVDSAIMDAIVDEWAQRDSRGAMAWTLANEEQVSNRGAQFIAKNLLLNEVHGELAAFHAGLISSHKRDTVASESARLLARRDSISSIEWLSAIESVPSKYTAYNDSLFEIGHDDFESSIRYAELAYGVAALDRETVLYQALQSWSLVDVEKVRGYLDSDDGFYSSGRLAALRESIN